MTSPDDHVKSPPPFSQAERLACVKVLTALAAEPAVMFDKGRSEFGAVAEVRAAANRLIAAVQAVVRTRRDSGRRRPPATTPHPPAPAAVGPAGGRPCYVCQRRFREAHPAYPTLCLSCGALNHAKREQTANLSGRRALVTGG